MLLQSYEVSALFWSRRVLRIRKLPQLLFLETSFSPRHFSSLTLLKDVVPEGIQITQPSEDSARNGAQLAPCQNLLIFVFHHPFLLRPWHGLGRGFPTSKTRGYDVKDSRYYFFFQARSPLT